MKNFIIGVVVFLMACAILGSCGDSSSGSQYSGYSNTYKNDSEYRQNVKDIAGAYGISEKEVDRKINAITGGK